MRQLLRYSAILFLTLLATPALAQECSTSWVGGDYSGDWHTATGWTNGVPGPGSVVCITAPGDYQVLIAVDVIIQELHVGADSGTQTVLSTRSVQINGQGTSVVGTNGRWFMTRSSGSVGINLAGTLLVEGEASLAQSVSFMTASGTLDVAPGGRFEMVGGANAGGAESLFRIRGTLEGSNCSGSSGNCQLNSPIEVDGGTISLLSGQLDVRRPGSMSNPTLFAAEGTTLRINASQVPAAERVFAVDGTIAGNPEGLVDWAGVDLDAGPNTVTLAMGGTGFQFRGITGSPAELRGTTGSFVNTGLALIGGGASWGQGIRGVTLRNESALHFLFTNTFWDDAVLENTAGGTVSMTSSSSASGSRLDGEGAFVNHGVLTRSPVGSTTRIGVAYHGQPGSSIVVPAGRFDMESGGSLEDATFVVTEGAELQFRGQGDDRLWTLNGTLSGDIDGLLRWYGLDFAAGPSNPVLNFTGEGLQFSGQTGRITQFTNGGGTLTNVGVIRLAGLSGWGIGIRGATVVNEGLIELFYSLRFWEDGLLRNQPNGVIRMVNDGFGSFDSEGIVENYGLIVRQGNDSAVGFNSTLRSMPGSELRVLTGRLDLDPPGEHSFPTGTTVTGTNQVRLIPDLTVGGTISPGTAEQPIATQEFVSSLQMSPITRTVIDIGANGESDTIIPASGVNSTTLDGTLIVRVAPGFTPSPGDEWTIFLRSANPYMIQGEFHTIEVEGDVPDGVGFVTEKPNDGVVVLRAVTGATIESLAELTVEGGPPVQFVISVADPVPPGSVVEIPLAFEGSATRYIDYVVDITGSVARIPAGQTQTTITLFPLADDLEEDDETVTIRILSGGDVAPGSPDAATIVIEDGPLTSTLAVGGVAPSRGGNGGTVSATIFGQGFGENAVVRLQQGGTIVTGTNVAVNEFGTGLTARFDLSGAPLGSYNVVVESGGDSSTLPGSFAVEAPSGLDLWADITGTPNPRQFRWSTYTLTVGNTGNQDIYDTLVLVRISPGIEYEITGTLHVDDVWDLPPDPENNDHIGLNVETATVVPLYLYRIPAGDVNVVTIRIRPTTAVGTGAGVSYELYPPDPFGAFTWSGDFEDIDQDSADGYFTNWVVMFGAITGAVDLLLDEDRASSATSRRVSYTDEGLRAGGLNNPWDGRPRDYLTMPELVEYYSWATNLGDNPMDALTVTLLAAAERGITITSNPAVTAAALNAAIVWGGPVAIGLAALRQGLATALFASGERAAGRIVCKFVGAPGCSDPPGSGGGAGNGGGSGNGDTGGPGNGPAGGFGGGAGGKVGGAVDPNDKLGPAGFDEPRYFRTDDPLFYLIRYENLDTASFPAQEVIIIDDIDTSVYDLSTFSLGPITLPDRVVTPPAGVQSFHTVLDLAPELPALLVISAGIDLETGRAVWTFVTLDPNTMDLPEDGMIGFLPPNVDDPEGEGAVSFMIEMLPDLSTNTDVSNLAEIYFDLNDPIITPVWSNRVDRDPPTTTVVPLPPDSESPLTIEIAGTDLGSGIQLYTLFVSTDGGPFQLYATSTEPSFEFEGEEDVMYGFYSRAIDFVQNVEPPKDEAEATIVFGVSTEGGSGLPRELTLNSPYPNPASGPLTLKWGLPAAAEPDIRIYDVLGREVLRVLDGTPRSAGWHETALDARLASGVYVVRLSAERDGRVEHRSQRLVVVR